MQNHRQVEMLFCLIANGVVLNPIVINRQKKVIDGRHRIEAYLAAEIYEVEAEGVVGECLDVGGRKVVARRVRLLAPPRIMKERHLRLELAQDAVQPPPLPGSSGAVRAVGWNLAARAAQLGLAQGSMIDVAYRMRENEHPEYGGLEAEIAGIELA